MGKRFGWSGRCIISVSIFNTATMLIPYTHFERDILEMEDFITAALPGLLDDLSIPVFLLLEGRITAEEAIDMVRSDIIGERGRM